MQIAEFEHIKAKMAKGQDGYEKTTLEKQSLKQQINYLTKTKSIHL